MILMIKLTSVYHIRTSQWLVCKNENLLSFDKYFVKLICNLILSRKLYKKVDFTIFSCETSKLFFHHHTVWKSENFSLTEKIFRQINSLVIYLLKPLLSRNFYQKCVRGNSRNFHTVSHEILSKIPWKQRIF